MNAIIVTGGKQYKVAEGDTLFIEKLEAEAGQEIVFDQVLPSWTATRLPSALPPWRALPWPPPS